MTQTETEVVAPDTPRRGGCCRFRHMDEHCAGNIFIVCWYKEKWSRAQKIATFNILTIIVLFVTAGLIGTTIQLNLTSATKGPIHWHADHLFDICDEYMEFEDPTGIRNKVGTPILHEHNDDRVHIEGTPHALTDIDLGN